MTKSLLEITNLHVSIDEKHILNGIDVTMKQGEIHAIMGPNGSGKSTLSLSLMGHPSYQVSQGTVLFNGQDLLEMSVDGRARSGLFLAFQYPYEIEGLTFKDFLRQAYNAWYGGTEKQIGLKAFRRLLDEKMDLLGIDHSFVERSLNVGFSGGEKKRAEMLQMAVLQPRLVILDEIDSGLDVDALRNVAHCLQVIKKDQPDMGILLITHYQRILDHISPDYVHIMKQGRIARSGDAALAHEVETQGYS